MGEENNFIGGIALLGDNEGRVTPGQILATPPKRIDQLEVTGTVEEATVTFKAFSDRTCENIVNAETKEVLISISGYDLRIGFNLKHLQSVEEIEAAIQGIGSLFRNMITEALLGNNAENA